MFTSVNREHREASDIYLPQNAVTAGVDFTQYFKDRLYYIDLKTVASLLNGAEEAISRLQQNPVHYYQRTSADYLELNDKRKSLTGTGGNIKIGRKGHSKWTVAESFGWSSPGLDLNDVGYLRQSDVLLNVTQVEYKQTNVRSKFRSNTLSFQQENKWDYGRTAVENNVSAWWGAMLMNRMEFSFSELYNWNYVDTRVLRGGPNMRYSPFFKTSFSYNISPDLSIQLYASPFTSVGKYSHFKKATQTMSPVYNERFESFKPEDITFNDNTYTVNSEGISFSDPNFSFDEFRSNLVTRWEFHPGSTLYFVWEYNTSGYQNQYVQGWDTNLNTMFHLPSTNIFMIKFNYLIGL